MLRRLFTSAAKELTPEEKAQQEWQADRADFFRAISKNDAPKLDSIIKKYGKEALDWEKSRQSCLHYALRKNKLVAFTALLDHGADTGQKTRIEGEYGAEHLNVMEHALYHFRDKFVYAMLQRGITTPFRYHRFHDEETLDMIKRADKIRAEYLAQNPDAPRHAPAAHKPPMPPSMKAPPPPPPKVDTKTKALQARVAELETALKDALARIEKLENPDNTASLDKPNYPTAPVRKPK